MSHFIWRTKTPDLPAVLLEDLAALVGLVFALAGVALSAITHRSQWDGAGSLAIGALLGVVAVILAIEMKSRLIGESASAAVQLAIVAAMEDGPELQRVIYLRTVHLGPEVLLVTARVAILGEQTGFSIASGIGAAERRIRAAVPIAKLIYLEPDLYRASGEDMVDPPVRAVRRHPR